MVKWITSLQWETICTLNPLLNVPIRYEYESIYMPIMSSMDKTKQFHYNYTIKQIKQV